MLLLGETGVGKTMFAECLHRYAVEVGKMAESAPFVTFNCADYASNPQLLLGQLFGVKERSVYRGTGTAGTVGNCGWRRFVFGRGSPPSRRRAGDAVHLYR